ncbi:MAG: SUMF1/EgtB/PvdO family nonheme iron enzyme [Myxococcales bacterium]|nr:SUMF1/EgtB/PvdO family nonheme iron enzyme [Myxococcales bacterium]
MLFLVLDQRSVMAHTQKVAGSGWQASWDKFLKARKEIELGMAAGGSMESSSVDWCARFERVHASWWTQLVRGLRLLCLGRGRLPTDAEWNYVAVGGSEQRKYPWGSEPPDPTRATLTYTPAFKETGHLTPVGSAPRGASRWGVFDMAGSRREFVRDGSATTTPDIGIPVPCTDCFRRDNTETGHWIQRNFHWVAGPEYANVGERLMLVRGTGAQHS